MSIAANWSTHLTDARRIYVLMSYLQLLWNDIDDMVYALSRAENVPQCITDDIKIRLAAKRQEAQRQHHYESTARRHDRIYAGLPPAIARLGFERLISTPLSSSL